jgi:hypothetical protein
MSEKLQKLDTLHRAIDTISTALSARHAARLKCKLGCFACCTDGLTVFDVEAERIQQGIGETLRGARPSVEGCAFLDEQGGCRIYAYRPYVCKTQGLPLRWFDDAGHERRDICPLNQTEEPLSSLDPADCWTIGRAEDILRELSDGERVALRDLFFELSK